MSLTQVSYSMISGNMLNAVDYGAKLDNSTPDDAAILACWNALSFGQKMYIPYGKCRIQNPLTLTATVGGVGIVSDGWFNFDAGAGLVVDGAGFRDLFLKLQVTGGNAGDTAIKLLSVKYGDLDIYGDEYAGTVLWVAGANSSNNSNQFCLVRKLQAYNCGQCLFHGDTVAGGYGDSFGTYVSILDINSANGSVIQNSADITILSYENAASSTQVDSLKIAGGVGGGGVCGAIHIGKINIGNISGVPSGYLLNIDTVNGVDIDALYMIGTSTSVNGLRVKSVTNGIANQVYGVNLGYNVNLIDAAPATSFRIGSASQTNCTYNIYANGVNITNSSPATFDTRTTFIPNLQSILYLNYFDDVADTTVTNNTLFLDTATGKLSWKDGTGTVHTLY